ncbi:MAG: sigma-70 family RNA polymerase sigma factor [Aphanocapsa sp. GSE-SYN-MK-11-07L]|jgi:RNA polymerase sigma-70 factor (ECF subfamily)|nr:sigma-70 family RNA polymerase sigma factor [Aphanocapsa sp. GSE-SYN-MK-11-07L]
MALADHEDAAVIRAMRSGDLAALKVLYNRYGEAIYRLALRILSNVHEAEDLTQEVFLTFWRTETYDSARGSVLVFLLTMTRSRAINRLNQVRSQQKLLQRWQHNRPSHAPNVPMENASLSELSHRVLEALQVLPDSQRQVLEMAYYDGLSQSEITQQLNIPLGTVKTRSRQGLLKLRQLLTDWVE